MALPIFLLQHTIETLRRLVKYNVLNVSFFQCLFQQGESRQVESFLHAALPEGATEAGDDKRRNTNGGSERAFPRRVTRRPLTHTT